MKNSMTQYPTKSPDFDLTDYYEVNLNKIKLERPSF